MQRSWIHQLAVAGVLYGFWVVLSGRLEPKYLAFGAICTVLVTLLSARLLYTDRSGSKGPSDPGASLNERRRWLSLMPWHRLMAYIPWLAVEIVKANLVIVPMILGSRSRLRPRVFTLETKLDLEVSRTAFGNSITMTPGTLTMDLSADGEYLVHALDEALEEGVSSRRMEGMVGWAFGDPLRSSSPGGDG